MSIALIPLPYTAAIAVLGSVAVFVACTYFFDGLVAVAASVIGAIAATGFAWYAVGPSTLRLSDDRLELQSKMDSATIKLDELVSAEAIFVPYSGHSLLLKARGGAEIVIRDPTVDEVRALCLALGNRLLRLQRVDVVVDNKARELLGLRRAN